MHIDEKILKEYLKNVYFINGTAYAGKSTACKILAQKHDMILCGENYGLNEYMAMTTIETHPNMNYFKTMKNWEEFLMRSKEDYDAWSINVSNELVPFEILELISISKTKKVIVDTNIPHEVLSKISDYDHVAYMVATPEIAMKAFFERDDLEKRFMLQVLEKMPNPEQAKKHYEETIHYLNRQEKIDAFLNSGYFVIQRKTIEETIDDKILQLEKHFKLS